MGGCNNKCNTNNNSGLADFCYLFFGFLFFLFILGILYYLYQQSQHQQAMSAAMIRGVPAATAIAPTALAQYPVSYAAAIPPAAAVSYASAAMVQQQAPSLCGRAVSSGGPYGSCIICGCDVKDTFVSCCAHLQAATSVVGGRYCEAKGCGVAA